MANKTQPPRCANCHQFTSQAHVIHYCSNECVFEWTAKIIDAETPQQIWQIVDTVRLLAHPGHDRATTIGRLIQLAHHLPHSAPTRKD